MISPEINLKWYATSEYLPSMHTDDSSCSMTLWLYDGVRVTHGWYDYEAQRWFADFQPFTPTHWCNPFDLEEQ